MFLDWLQYTIKEVWTDKDDVRLMLSRVCSSLPVPIQDLIGYHSPDFDRIGYTLCKGINHYSAVLLFDNGLKICYNPPNVRMGTNIIISGSVLKLKPLSPDDVKDWIVRILPHFDYKIGRVDIAQDTDVDFSYFYDKYVSGEFITRYLTTTHKSYLNFDNRGTLYFGARGKGTYIRIYDKYLEQWSKLKSKTKKLEFECEFGGKSWTRLEMECKDSQAEQMLCHFIEGRCGDVFLGHLRFVKEMKSNKARCVTCDIYLNVISAEGCRKLSKVNNTDLNLDWIVNVAFANTEAIKEVHPRLYDVLTQRVVASPQAVSKAKLSKMDLDRLYFSLIKQENIDNDGLIEPAIINQTLKFKECM